MGPCWAAGLSGFEMGGASSTSEGFLAMLMIEDDEDIGDSRKHHSRIWSVISTQSPITLEVFNIVFSNHASKMTLGGGGGVILT